jgi:nicotinamidase-related amidase
MARVWDALFSDLDREIYGAAGYGARGEGGERPALLIIDVTYEFVGDRPEPVLESIRRFPNSCGEVGWRAMEHIRDLQALCRELEVPIFYTKGMDDRSAITRGCWGWKKQPESDEKIAASPISNQIPDLIAPLPGEVVIQKTKPSGFFGTPLASYLTWLNVDTLLVTGTSTSGCVRATVVDSFSNNFRTLVVEEGVFDRGDLPHKANLFDMQAKYAEVIPVEAAKGYLRSLKGALVAR